MGIRTMRIPTTKTENIMSNKDSETGGGPITYLVAGAVIWGLILTCEYLVLLIPG